MDDVRIKDKMRSAYTPQQWMGAQIERLKARRFAETFRLEGWRIREATYHGPGHYEWLDRQWRPYRIGDEWGGQDHTAFFRCEAQVPESFDGRYCVLRLRPGAPLIDWTVVAVCTVMLSWAVTLSARAPIVFCWRSR